MNITLHLILIHFIYLYISICLYNSIRISLYFSTVFLRFTLQFSLTVISSYGFLFSTVASLTVGSPVRFPLRLSIRLTRRLAIRFSIRSTRRLALYSFLVSYSPHTLLSSLYTPHRHPLYSEYYLLLYPLLCSSLRFFLPRFFSHIFHSV